MATLSTGLRPEWLALREGADAGARAVGLLDPLRSWFARRSDAGLIIRDLGCGTGSMGRWLSGRLPRPQHWILHDRDHDLLDRAVGALPGMVSVSGEPGDITELRAADLAGTSLVTASALLDLLTAAEVVRLADACAAAGCPALLTLSVLGRAELDPADPLDEEIAAAFNAHQRREVAGRRLLGPDAFDVAIGAFSRKSVVYRQPSPWRLGPADAALTEEWLRGWVAAATEHRPDLEPAARPYLARRLAANAAGRLRVVVEHGDLLALPEVDS
ncbi:MAG TPA: SAM-dependent methyltransferase [Actinophytocola sp.]|uniref:SAM-dependent methyltransferase n=1 Tax=Actinophytocola sp. TaxID=1872138 RepID=UPI002DDCF4C0|nr:SAM-dependent methyltransferase [Actinophytocola sp.]HEV2781201.1 SAM-dependent methyltransferase [Actinophytocola sp.]